MRRLIIATLGSFLFVASPSIAADIPVRQAAPVVAAPIFSWTGFYIGVHAGYGGDQFEYPFTILGVVGSAELTSSGGFAGGQIGYNWQTGNWMFGVEADIAWSDIAGRISIAAGGANGTAGSELRWFGTARGRMGYTWDRFMIYGTGGYAYGNVRSTATASAAAGGLVGLGGITFSNSEGKSGWAAGGGFEYALAPNWSIKAEYLYLDFGRDLIFSSPVFSISEETTVHTIKAGLNFRFAGR